MKHKPKVSPTCAKVTFYLLSGGNGSFPEDWNPRCRVPEFPRAGRSSWSSEVIRHLAIHRKIWLQLHQTPTLTFGHYYFQKLIYFPTCIFFTFCEHLIFASSFIQDSCFFVHIGKGVPELKLCQCCGFHRNSSTMCGRWPPFCEQINTLLSICRLPHFCCLWACYHTFLI